MALHYPIYIKPPARINITSEQFHNLSYFGLGSLFLSFKAVIEKKKDMYTIYTGEALGGTLHEYRKNRFKGCNFWENQSAELVIIDVPIDHPLIKSINTYCSRLIMESTKSLRKKKLDQINKL